MITGKKLIDLGFKPDKWFGEAIRIANDKCMSDVDLINLCEELSKDNTIKPYEYPINYRKNILASSSDEIANVISVFETMDEVMKTPTVVDGAIMPDACPTGEIGQIPVGGVVVAKNAIHPSMHSADICCSLMATNLGKINPKKALDLAEKITHFGSGGRKSNRFKVPNELLLEIKSNPFLCDKRSVDLAKSHLGTQGDGNHFLFVGISEKTGDTILVTHHGSRGFGAELYKKGMRAAEKFRRELSPKTLKRNAWIPYDSKTGGDYWRALQTIRKWTKLNHKVIHESVCRKLGLLYNLSFWNEHNFVFKDGDLFYHAKGATPLDDKFVPDSFKGLRLIPLNMSQPVLVVKGVTTENNLGFAPHGAGRNTSRSEHKRRNESKTDEQIFIEETKGIDARFFSGNIDISELPSAYKDAASVESQISYFGLGEVVDRINPYGCIMAGNWKSSFR